MTEQTDLRALDRALAEALGWRAEVISFPWQSRRWAIVDSNHSPIDNDAKAVALTAEAAWEFCPPFSADTLEGWGAVGTHIIPKMRELGYELDVWEKPAGHYRVTWYVTNGTGRWIASADSLPAAVARASLAALSAKEAPDGN